MMLAQLVTKLNSKGFVWLRKRMTLAPSLPMNRKSWQRTAKTQTIWQLMRMILAEMVAVKGFG